MKLLEQHIFTEVGRYRGRIWQCDVANEFFADSNPSGINPNGPTTQVPTSNLAVFAQPYEFGQMIKAALAVPECISFTVWGFGDADSWVPGFFKGKGYATIYDVNLQPKLAFSELMQELRLGALGAPSRVIPERADRPGRHHGTMVSRGQMADHRATLAS